MSTVSIRISGTGSYLPARRIATRALARESDAIDPEWVLSRLGIESRHVAASDERSSDLAALAAWAALGNAGCTPADCDLLIVATATPDQQAPSTASIVHAKLGMPPMPAFDIGAVCSGFLFAITTAAQFVETGAARRALVVGVDTFSTITDWSRRDAAFFGDGAGAVVIERAEAPSYTADLRAIAARHQAFTVPRGAHSFRMDAASVAAGALEGVPGCVEAVLARTGLAREEIDAVVPHQPSLNLLQRIADVVRIPFERFHTTLRSCGNTAAATIPLTLDHARREGRLRPGQNLLFIAAGAGMTAGAAIYRWH